MSESETRSDCIKSSLVVIISVTCTRSDCIKSSLVVIISVTCTKYGCILTPPSSKMGLSLVFGADGRYSAFRLCARHVRSADT
eukprot:COSAG06_NODE_31115_length_526_cov_5.861827_2_plen_82_part_01